MDNKQGQNTKKRQLQGVVVSDKMGKTVVVKVARVKEHPKYRKQYHTSKNYKAHDENNEYHMGDNVLIEETKPLSRDKHWRVVRALSKNPSP